MHMKITTYAPNSKKICRTCELQYTQFFPGKDCKHVSDLKRIVKSAESLTVIFFSFQGYTLT